MWDATPSTASEHLKAFALESLRHMQGDDTEPAMKEVIQKTQTSEMQTAGCGNHNGSLKADSGLCSELFEDPEQRSKHCLHGPALPTTGHNPSLDKRY